MLKYAALTVCCVVSFTYEANALSCRSFAREVKAGIGSHVAALQRYEHEAADRLKGLDSRPFDFLLGEARKTTAVIADAAALKDEEALARCRNPTKAIRKLCADAAQRLVEILDRHAATAKPDYDRAQYAALMGECEKLIELKPLKSAIRGTE
jgi:hypothetical protein